MNNEILKPTQNDTLHLLSGIDLQDVLTEVENYQLEYRKKLDLPESINFGTEIEYEGYPKSKVTFFINKKHKTWHSKSDASVPSGGEITSPIMNDKGKNWLELQDICKYLTRKNVDTSHNAGGHIHIDKNILEDSPTKWKSFFGLYICYEHILFRFLYGDKINARPKMNDYARPYADSLKSDWSKIKRCRYFIDFLNATRQNTKYNALNLLNVDFLSRQYTDYKNTIEFRSPNGSSNEIIWQNNINALTKMLLSAKNQVIADDFIDYKIKKEYTPYHKNPILYSTINLQDVLEFVDIVFDNNLDKLYFLRQYLKNFEENYLDTDYAIPAKKFVK